MNNFKLCAFADEAGADINCQIRALKENQIDFLELRGVCDKNVSDLSISEAKELKKHLDKEKIKVWSIGSPIGKINITDDFKAHKELFLHTLEIAKITGASCIRLFSFYMPEEKQELNNYRDEVIERLSYFCDSAKGSGITLCHENEKGIFGDTAQNCLYIHKQLSGLKSVFDPANFVQTEQDVIKSWDILSPYIHYVHIKDSLKDGSVVPAGRGDGHIREVLEKYKAQNGEMLTIEPHLSEFAGLDKLEHGEKSKVGTYTYKNQREAFDDGVNSLKKLIGKR